MSRSRIACSTLLLCATLNGCGTDAPAAPVASSPPPPPPPTAPAVARVEVAPASLRILPGGSARIRVSILDASGNVLSDRAVAWGTSDPLIATVSANGEITGLATGMVSVTATSEGRSGSATAHVATVAFSTIAAGDYHTCGLATTGEAYCWGENAHGQLGSADETGNSLPQPVLGDLQFVSLTSGARYSCGLTAEGTAYCWGSNTWGELGAGARTLCPNRNNFCTASPTRVQLDKRIAQIVAGFDHACAITADAETYCWGWGDNGELGSALTAPCNFLAEVLCSMVPRKIDAGGPFVAIAAGYEHTCGLIAGGQAYCWGHEHDGQLGTGDLTLGGPLPRAVSGGLRFASLSARGNATCGVALDNTAHCWGENSFGQLGASVPLVAAAPITVSGSLSFSALTVGGGTTCGVAAGNAPFCWGNNANGMVGDGSTIHRTSPTAVIGGQFFRSISAGAFHACGITTDGVAYCWGLNNAGQLGSNVPTSPLPIRVGGQP